MTMTPASSLTPVELNGPSVPQIATSEASSLISLIERAARDPAVDVDKMERLFAMKERADAAAAKQAFLNSFADLQAVLPAAARGGKGHNERKYARFEDVMAALRQPLAENGFSINHRVNTENNIIRVTGILGHRAGHTVETEMTLPPDTSGGKTPVHAMASAISYGKRYVTLTLTGIATEDDDDAAKVRNGGVISDSQTAELVALFETTDADIPGFCKYFKIDKYADLKASDFPRAIAALKKKQSAK